MKQKLSVLILSILCVCLLAGCACRHEWTEADCLNPKVCTKCDATEGEALGHDWQDATCQAPRTCTRCGTTEGEIAEHTYGSWTTSDTDKMERICTVCGDKETQAVDQAVLIPDKLKNTHWVGSHLIKEGITYYLEDLQTAAPQGVDLLYSINFNSTNGFSMVLASEKPVYGSWELKEQQVTENSNGYHLLLKDAVSNQTTHVVLFDKYLGCTCFSLAQDIGNDIILFYELDHR